jgi:hypothetical protein
VSSNLIAPTISNASPTGLAFGILRRRLLHYHGRMRTTTCLIVCLLLSSCGGGANTADSVNAEAKFIPDFSTAVGTTQAFMRAVQTDNIGLLSMLLMDEEREEVLPIFEKRFADSRREGVTWELEQMEGDWEPEKEARSLFKFTELKDGKPTGNVTGGWYVFVKTTDGSWKFSQVATKRWIAEVLEAKKKQQAENSAD